DVRLKSQRCALRRFGAKSETGADGDLHKPIIPMLVWRLLQGMTMPDLDRNKENVLAFYDLMFNQCRPREAIERYAGAEYIQHNPLVADGKEPFIAYFEKMAREFPGKRVYVKRAFAEGNYVILHCYQHWPTEKDKDWAGMDIFRMDDDGKIV